MTMMNRTGYYAEFERFVKNNSQQGIDSNGNLADYVRLSDLKDFWSVRKIREVLEGASPVISLEPEKIQSDLLLIFSTLVYNQQIGALEFFFRGDKLSRDLPLEETAQVSGMAERHLKQFRKSQWRFCPLSLQGNNGASFLGRPHDRVLMDRQILPIRSWPDPLKGSGPHRSLKDVYIVDWGENLVEGATGSESTKLALKAFDPDLEGRARKEAQIYRSLQSSRKPSENIVRYYGSFIHGGKYYIALEYADKGSLLDYFQRSQHRPYWDQDSLENFFLQLFELFSALERLQDGNYQIVHRDIQPSNILVFTNSDGTITLKLTDFECATTVVHGDDGQGGSYHYEDGNRTFSAPERASFLEVDDASRRQQSSKWQIFELGALISECLVWAAFGNDGREKYREERRSELQPRQPMADPAGYEYAFHDGLDGLECVRKWHHYAVQELPLYANVAECARQVLEKYVLVKVQDRQEHPRKVNELFQTSFGAPTARTPPSYSLSPPPKSSVSSSSNSRATWGPSYSRRQQPSAGSSTYQHSNATSNTENALNIRQSTPGDLGMVETPPGRRRQAAASRASSSSVRFAKHPTTNQSHSSSGYMSPDALFWSPQPLSSHEQPVAPANRPYEAAVQVEPPTHPSQPEAAWREEELQEGNQIRRDMRKRYGSPTQPNPARRPREETRQPTLTQTQHPHPRFDPTLSNTRMVQAHPHMQPPFSCITVERIYQAKQEGMDISRWGVYRRIQNQLKTREVVLLIDDSSHMKRQYKDQMKMTLESVLLLTRETDPNGLEAYLTSDPSTRIKPLRTQFMGGIFKGPEALESAILAKMNKDGGPDKCDMEKALTDVLHFIMRSKRKFKPTTLLVMTDGDWDEDWDEDWGEGQSASCGSETPIINAVKRLNDWEKSRSDLAIQFIRFGHHPTGIRRLEHLDNFLRNPANGAEFNSRDIVDHKYFLSPVDFILIGAASQDADREPHTPQWVRASPHPHQASPAPISNSPMNSPMPYPYQPY